MPTENGPKRRVALRVCPENIFANMGEGVSEKWTKANNRRLVQKNTLVREHIFWADPKCWNDFFRWYLYAVKGKQAASRMAYGWLIARAPKNCSLICFIVLQLSCLNRTDHLLTRVNNVELPKLLLLTFRFVPLLEVASTERIFLVRVEYLK